MSLPGNNLSRVDVAVIGGGPAGLATAIALRREGVSVAVFERTDYQSPRVGEHIPPGAKPLLAALGLADVLAWGRHASCPGICSIWGSDEPASRHYLFHPEGEGLNLSRPDFDLSLATRAQELGAAVLTRATVVSLSRAAGSWDLCIKSTAAALETRCTVLVDATGRNASIAKRLGTRPVVYDELIGFIGNAGAVAPRNKLVMIEALPQGWWYSAGLADGSLLASFLTDPGLIETSTAARRQAWHALLDKARMTAARIAAPAAVPEIFVRTARTQRLAEVTGEGWLATGDAAMSFDPLSSEGISKGLEWGKRAGAVAAALCRGDRSAASGYRDDLNKAFAEYLVARYRYYAAEKRWPHAPFWRRRQLPPRPLASASR